MQVINDNLKIDVTRDDLFDNNPDKETESGILVEVPDQLFYLGKHSQILESSFMSDDLKTIIEYYKKLIGKRVYWTWNQDRGLKYKEDKKVFAYIKMTDIIGFSDPDDEAETVQNNEMRI